MNAKRQIQFKLYDIIGGCQIMAETAFEHYNVCEWIESKNIYHVFESDKFSDCAVKSKIYNHLNYP